LKLGIREVSLFVLFFPDGILSYSMPQGDKRGASWEFFDSTYDGEWEPEPHGGLGQLTDTVFGEDTFKMSYFDENDKGRYHSLIFKSRQQKKATTLSHLK